MGMEKTKWRARQTVYWLGIGRDIELIVSRCSGFVTIVGRRFRKNNVKEPLISISPNS